VQDPVAEGGAEELGGTGADPQLPIKQGTGLLDQLQPAQFP
jgi:hypothetical protein